MQERDLERGLLEHLRLFISELGKGFAFVGSQYLEVGGQDYYLDLLFYHLRLCCFVIFELKIEEFKPEFAGKMNFYLSAVGDQLKHADDQPSKGVILCKGRNILWWQSGGHDRDRITKQNQTISKKVGQFSLTGWQGFLRNCPTKIGLFWRKREWLILLERLATDGSFSFYSRSNFAAAKTGGRATSARRLIREYI